MNIQWKFAINDAQRDEEPGWTRLALDDPYDPVSGFGFTVAAEASKNEDLRDSWPGDYFDQPVPTLLIDVPYGNYKVTITLGSEESASDTTVKAGLGHILLKDFALPPGKTVRRSFAVHVEDGQLKLAVAGAAPKIRSVEIERAPVLPTLYLAGDSTVTDQPSGQYPYSGWGQMIGLFLTSDIAVSNQARSGRSSKSFISESRLNKIWKKLRPSDVLLVQFAHNDEKDNDGGTEPFSTYQQHLKLYIDGARHRGAYPVLVSPMHRRFFDEQGNIRNTHGDYIEAMKQLAEAERVPYIDLAARSKTYFERLGEDATKHIFLWAAPGECVNFPEGLQDNTYFSERGAIEIARLVAECVQEAGIEPLATYMRAPMAANRAGTAE
ncbi:rhamnogalacturonan acetylesterase [Paenibacillus allorhizosphaerae]|uniref:SGNH hydrolase-type esterase domain-containing protein n=1 Tax=Paenibacillus allorhizosphaerae TaxID=2849866 RepID=A0ABM8VIG7_9BACL|nr:rhamnogalacturonan acetylesterase [Paenibacillus allorhizosphaerae]CAG7643195.1 hypothetical protein PAECIP111802_02969 [Paenibacillus allorhizosphaerae]